MQRILYIFENFSKFSLTCLIENRLHHHIYPAYRRNITFNVRHSVTTDTHCPAYLSLPAEENYYSLPRQLSVEVNTRNAVINTTSH